MGPIICDISSWQYHGTPPALRDVEIPPEIACAPAPEGLALPPSLFTPRSNAREAEHLIGPRLLADLKGLSLPIHVMVDDASDRHTGKLIHPHRIPSYLSASDIIPIGNNLSVVRPEIALLQMAQSIDHISLLLAMFEACGIYALAPKNKRTRFALYGLHDAGLLDIPQTNPINAFSDASGAPLFLPTSGHDTREWQPSFNRHGQPTDIWKRVPLTSPHLLSECAQQAKSIRNIQLIRKAIAETHEGSGSPLETRASLLMFPNRWKGGEGWPWPDLNRRVDFDPNAQMLSHQTYCSCDMLFADLKVDIEINSLDYHADKRGFKLESGRTAGLRSMGYTVLDITYDQLCSLERFDALMESFSREIGIPLKPKTAAFLERRELLHRALFGRNR